MKKMDLISKFRADVTSLAINAIERRLEEGYPRIAVEEECKLGKGGVSRYLDPHEPRLPDFDVAMRILETLQPEVHSMLQSLSDDQILMLGAIFQHYPDALALFIKLMRRDDVAKNLYEHMKMLIKIPKD